MWPDRVSNPGPPTYESGALPIPHVCNICIGMFKSLDCNHGTKCKEQKERKNLG